MRSFYGPFLGAILSIAGGSASAVAADQAPALKISPTFAKSQPVTMDQLSKTATAGVSVLEVSDYVFGGYKGDFTGPSHADINPRKAFVIFWKDFNYRFVFSHEASYCPWFELPSGAGACYQFFEGNDGWAELFNDFGRRERNSFVDIMDPGPSRVWVRWTYIGVNQNNGDSAYRGVEDFWAYPNGLILRRQTYETMKPGKHEGYTREPIENIGMAPAGKLWKDVLQKDPKSEERHCLAVLDAFSDKRYDDYWTPKPDTVWDSTRRHSGCTWKEIDDARGVAIILPMTDGLTFCAYGDASGFDHTFTRIKEHSFPETGGSNWGSSCWDHWPIGWLNSQAHPVDDESLKKYPNHFSPAGMDFFALADDESARGSYWSLYGVGKDDESIRRVTREWLDKGESVIARGDGVNDLARLDK